jgi:hypothetical protein
MKKKGMMSRRKKIENKGIVKEVGEKIEEESKEDKAIKKEEEKLKSEINEIDEARNASVLSNSNLFSGISSETSSNTSAKSGKPYDTGNKDPAYKAILEKNKKLKDKINAVARYIIGYDGMYFYFTDEGKGIWIERHYPEVKGKRKLIIKKINELMKK